VIPKGKDTAGTSSSLPKANKEGFLAELMEVSKTLGGTTSINIARKARVDKLIESMKQEVEAEDREDEAEAEEY
jgi:hypothetical protein